jgi:hypothetical protein
MSNGGIIDVSTGAAQAIGRYFSVISVIPSSLYVAFVYLLVASGSWRHSPNWSQAFKSLGHLGVEGIALLALFSVGLGVAIHPIQFSLVQFFEGYWGTTPVAQAIRSRRITHYQDLCKKLRDERICAAEQLEKQPVEASEAAVAASRAKLLSQYEEARRVRSNFPRAMDQVMPTRLGNVLRRFEYDAGRQYSMDAIQIVPLLLLVAPASHVDYVNDQRTQLDLAVRMTFISAVAIATAIFFLWPYGYWALVAIVPYALAYLSYRGSVVAGSHYGSALDDLINLDRFALYEQLHLKLPAGTVHEREMNEKLKSLFMYNEAEIMWYEHPASATPKDSASG